MKIISINKFVIPDVKIIRFARFRDQRGYFAESFRNSDFFGHRDMGFMSSLEFVQINESYSHASYNPRSSFSVESIHG